MFASIRRDAEVEGTSIRAQSSKPAAIHTGSLPRSPAEHHRTRRSARIAAVSQESPGHKTSARRFGGLEASRQFFARALSLLTLGRVIRVVASNFLDRLAGLDHSLYGHQGPYFIVT